MYALKLTVIPIFAGLLSWLIGWDWSKKELTISFLIVAPIIILLVVARRAREIESPVIIYHVRAPHAMGYSNGESHHMARISIHNKSKELYLSYRPRTGNKADGVTSENFERDGNATPPVFRANDEKGVPVSPIYEDPLKVASQDMLTITIDLGMENAEPFHQYAYFVTGDFNVHHVPIHKLGKYVAIGKNLRFEKDKV